MREDENTHLLKMRRKSGLKTGNTDEEGQKHTLPRDEETKGSLRTVSTYGGGQKHALPRGNKGGSEHSKHRWGRMTTHTI